MFDYITTFTVGLSIILAAGLLIRSFRFRHIIFSLSLIFISYIHLYIYLVYTQKIIEFPHLFFIQFPIALSLGPLIYLYSQSLTDDKTTINKIDLMHFVPAIIFLLILSPYISLSAEKKIEIIKNIFIKKEYPIFNYSIAVTISTIVFYTIISIRNLYKSMRQENPMHNRLLFFLGLLIFMLIIGITGIYAALTVNYFLLKINNILISIVVILIYLTSQRYPYLLQHGTFTVQKKSVKKSHLTRVDILTLNKQLKLLMKEDKFYCDEDLTLAKLSDALEITPHQLSEFLNEYHKKNFNSFINFYRVNDAKNMLLEEPNRNTLSIAYAVGFNSYSSFHSVFKKETGDSPANFRQKNLQKR